MGENHAALSGLIGEFEAGWETICGHHRAVTRDTTILVASRGRRALDGYHSPSKWATNGSVLSGEVMIAAEGLNRSPTDVFITLLHEAVHSANATAQTSDTSQGGRYHNTKFARRAEAMGLTVERAERNGWAVTGLNAQAEARYADTIQRLERALTLYRKAEAIGDSTPGPNKNLLKAVCDCTVDNSIRTSRRRLDKGLVCPACGSYFKAEGGDE